MISVVMATYNGAKYLEQQLDSILGQTTSVQEIIIVDDGSKDKTLEILNRYQKQYSHIQIYQNEKNLGPARTFAKATLLSKGDLIFFCDQDDIWLENKVEKVRRVFHEKENVQVLCTSYYLLMEKTSEIKNSSGHTGELTQISLERILIDNIAPGCTYAFRGEWREEAKKIQEDIFIHDWFYLVLGARENGLYFYDCPLIKYRIHAGNTIGLDLSFFDKFNRRKYIQRTSQNVGFYQGIMKQKLITDPPTIQILNKLVEMLSIRLAYVKGEMPFLKYVKQQRQMESKGLSSIFIDVCRKMNVGNKS
ncbi:MAG: glycosyltransferase family 2 protein [Turicibacter sp.]|nr:glycosyltransferase family 2 protein [Turicibacter sp.]